MNLAEQLSVLREYGVLRARFVDGELTEVEFGPVHVAEDRQMTLGEAGVLIDQEREMRPELIKSPADVRF